MQDIISSQISFFLSLFLFGIGAVGSLVLRKNDTFANWWGNLFAVFASIFGLISSVSVLLFGFAFSYTLNSSLPFFSLSFNVDKLSAFFIFIISLVSLFSSVYGIAYVKHFYKKYDIGALGFFYNVFIAGMFLVVSAANAVFFLIAWELMSLASYFLVIFENKEKENIKAGLVYFIMTHIGTAFIVLAFLFLYQATGSFDFAFIKNNIGGASPLIRDVVFIFALIGFGTKAGIIPFHVWLPGAHPAAPSHVSALMSGVMIKTGIYMMIRIFLDIMPNVPVWWGTLILIVGAISALLGVLYALTEHDIKRLLAYHSIENIGIILLGLGSSLVFLALNMSSLAILGLVAALFHILNHAIFKALLFLGAGSVISAARTRNMEEYGGLIKHMPQTAFFFLVGSMAISALPPFNGFFSEWLTFQSLFGGMSFQGRLIQWVFILAAGSLAFTGGLAAACFVKVFGITFLGRSRSEEASSAKESGAFLFHFGMAALAFLSLIIGVFAGKIAGFILSVAADINAFRFSEMPFTHGGNVFSLKSGFASVSIPLVFVSLLIAVAVAYFASRVFTGRRRAEFARTWDCGTDLNPRMEITATGFSKSIITIFQGILQPTRQTDIEYRDAEMRYFPKSQAVTMGTKDIYGSYLYKPAQNLALKISDYIKRIQSGNVNAYVAYIFFILIVLLLFATI